MLSLLDLPAIKNLPLGKCKVHLARGKESPFAFDEFLAGRFKEWQEYQNARNFECDTIISLIVFNTRSDLIHTVALAR